MVYFIAENILDYRYNNLQSSSSATALIPVFSGFGTTDLIIAIFRFSFQSSFTSWATFIPLLIEGDKGSPRGERGLKGKSKYRDNKVGRSKAR
jgi:hypothetical protein